MTRFAFSFPFLLTVACADQATVRENRMAEISRCEEDLKEIGDIPVEKNDDRLKMASDQDPVLRELISKDKDGDYCYGLSVNKLHQTCVYALSVDLDFGNEHIFCMARPGNTALN